ncbi:serine hydrolase [Lentimicrobium sp.]|jgi:CubicO group peptidase (beta-lactamase class C family)|uniref:serine hydrolase n=1 Tax=Lentimicrobium sp. TaxID=2034841 RepID=UPI0025DCEB94|nr:serine hydrolase [Lentimicrobium sp.]MCO5256535.1 serine hydrolase [Lentimicrobium sp.]HPF64434.1 serine hydrolase [Lentimicrobium sp.]HPJ62032.1 serine hydrolase [Lentimicrobium sp.]HPR25735.1 serine hydrolase [Lentimicrobium sp.]HRW69148.1 serine hydrolase [Lentimicrobium sp.]
MRFITKSFAAFLLTFLLLSNISAFCQNTKAGELDKYFAKALEKWKVPGMSVGIIKDNKVFLLKGYGVRESGKMGLVDENTMFAVASNTKSFTATALGMLVDEGKISWDDKVIDHLPWFRMYDPYVTMNTTIRDLLTHRSGLKTFSGDLIWYGSSHSREEVVKRAANLKPAHGFRTEYGYSNIMYLAAGLIIEKVSGISWDDFVSQRIFEPLGMTSSNTSITGLDLNGNTAFPHNDSDDQVIPIKYLNWDNIGPAGSINSTASDMLRWLRFQLESGKVNDKTLISEKTLRELWSPQIVQKVSPFSQKIWPSTHFKSYGMGWSLMDYHGKKIISHSGGYDGFISFSAFVPEANLGYVILTNKNSSLYLPLSYRILDYFLSDEQTDWSEKFYDLIEQGNAADKKQNEEDIAGRIAGTSPTLSLSQYCGTYTSEIYGEAEIQLRNDQLYLIFKHTPIFHSPLLHWHYNTFSLKFPDVPSLPEGKAAFILNKDHEVERMLIDVPNPDFDFTELEFIRK